MRNQTYLNCTRAGVKTGVTLDLRACLCTVQCPAKTRATCKSFKSVGILKLKAALEWIKNNNYSVPRETYKSLHGNVKIGVRPQYCSKCSSVKLNRDKDITCTVCSANSRLNTQATSTYQKQPTIHMPVTVLKTAQHDLPARATIIGE